MSIRTKFLLALAVTASFAVHAGQVTADPLPGEVLKFSQRPMDGVVVDGQPRFGHDELSTLHAPQPGTDPRYVGTFMADDFADKFDTPVVHVRWWGSYQQNQTFNTVPRFLIAWESDTLPDENFNFSRPGQVLQSEIVAKGLLAPGSGTFTEALWTTAPAGLEDIYVYNAELKLPFAEQADNVYWLKIVAVVDAQQDGPIAWGWHNRDYTIMDPLASTMPAVTPGEVMEGALPSGEPIWHFQDDAVTGFVALTLDPAAPNGYSLFQADMTPQHYVAPSDGPSVIQEHSKDLAFELYTVPEPGSMALAAMGLVGLAIVVRRARGERV